MGRILYHGGVRGLNAGDIIAGGHQRHMHDDCPMCRLHESGDISDPDHTQHPESAYCTRDKDYARMYAALCDGDLYQVKPDGCELLPGDADSDVEEYRCDRLKVVRVVERHVRLTWKDRRRYVRKTQRIEAMKGCLDLSNVLPRNATPDMIARWQRNEIANIERSMRI